MDLNLDPCRSRMLSSTCQAHQVVMAVHHVVWATLGRVQQHSFFLEAMNGARDLVDWLI